MAATGAKHLGTYLNDHVAGATTGVEVAKRAARHHRHDRDVLWQIAAEIRSDREELLAVMRSLSVPARTYKQQAAWLLEKLSRVKPNASLLRRSPVTDVIEVEALRLAVEGKAAGWRVLRRLAEDDGRLDAERLDALLERAARQAELLEDLRIRTAVDVFAVHEHT